MDRRVFFLVEIQDDDKKNLSDVTWSISRDDTIPETLLDSIILPQSPHTVTKLLGHFTILQRTCQCEKLSSIILNNVENLSYYTKKMSVVRKVSHYNFFFFENSKISMNFPKISLASKMLYNVILFVYYTETQCSIWFQNYRSLRIREINFQISHCFDDCNH